MSTTSSADNQRAIRQDGLKDPVFKKSTADADVDRLIRNTYKVLLTRGMVGTIVYSTDPETREKLREPAGGVERELATA